MEHLFHSAQALPLALAMTEQFSSHSMVGLLTRGKIGLRC